MKPKKQKHRDLAALHTLLHRRHELVAEAHPAANVKPVGHLGGQEHALAQPYSNLLRAQVVAPLVRVEDGPFEHLGDLDVGVARAAVEHAFGVGTGRGKVEHADVCQRSHACIRQLLVLAVCLARAVVLVARNVQS